MAEDRPGLLYDLASAISVERRQHRGGANRHAAHKAIDVFYVTAEGPKLPPEKQQILAEALRRACGQ